MLGIINSYLRAKVCPVFTDRNVNYVRKGGKVKLCWESRGKNSSAKEPYWALCKNKPGIFFKPVERSRLQMQFPNVVVINVL